MNNVNRSLNANRDSHNDAVSTTPTRTPMPHYPNTTEFTGVLEPGELPVEPDQGPVPTHVQEDPEHDRVVAPGDHAESTIPIARHPDDHKADTPPIGATATAAPTDVALPHERDESTNDTAQAPDPMMVKAKRDIDDGLVDTDMHVTPGLDANRRAGMVPGPGGKPIRSGGSS